MTTFRYGKPSSEENEVFSPSDPDFVHLPEGLRGYHERNGVYLYLVRVEKVQVLIRQMQRVWCLNADVLK